MSEISVTSSFAGRQWVHRSPVAAPDRLTALRERLAVSHGMAQILAARNLGDVGDATRFLNPAEDQLHDPFAMRGMADAVQRIRLAVDRFEKILVFGDYDVDGTASTSILYSYLKRLGARVFYYVPTRLSGYGFSAATLQIIADWDVDLVITTDHSSTDLEAPALLRALGTELIITDHHQLSRGRLPDAAALVNPNQPDCPYPFKELTATAVAYKVVCALDQALEADRYFDLRGICRTSPSYYLDMVALATVADMGPLVGENRTLVSLGLDMMNSNPRPGLAGLMRECMVRGPVTPSIISFKLAPKINALGRIGEPRLGVQLLLSHSYTEARRLARHMVNLNKQRQEIERRVYLRAMAQVELMKHNAVYILVGGDWHPGVLGSIATRIAIQTGKPTVVLTQEGDDGHASGSARCASGYNILNKLQDCDNLLERFGGHPCAAGLAVKADKLDDFKRHILAAIEHDGDDASATRPNQLEIEAWIGAEHLSPRFVEEISRLSPFGHGNPEPVVAVRGLVLRNPSIFNQRHLRFHLPLPDGSTIDAYAWEHAEWRVGGEARYDVAFMPQVYNGPDGVKHQVKVVDMKSSMD